VVFAVTLFFRGSDRAETRTPELARTFLFAGAARAEVRAADAPRAAVVALIAAATVAHPAAAAVTAAAAATAIIRGRHASVDAHVDAAIARDVATIAEARAGVTVRDARVDRDEPSAAHTIDTLGSAGALARARALGRTQAVEVAHAFGTIEVRLAAVAHDTGRGGPTAGPGRERAA
jgi:hypothetical protein